MKAKKGFTVADMLEQEQKKLEGYEKQSKDLQEKIKTCKANIQKYQLMYNSERLEELTKSLSSHGIKVEDVIAALANGDLTELQDRIDSSYGSAMGRMPVNADEVDEV